MVELMRSRSGQEAEASQAMGAEATGELDGAEVSWGDVQVVTVQQASMAPSVEADSGDWSDLVPDQSVEREHSHIQAFEISGSESMTPFQQASSFVAQITRKATQMTHATGIRTTTRKIITNFDTIDRLTLRLVSFEDRTELLRASSLSSIMSCFASIFCDSAGSASTYDLSKVVSQIDAFISHNWSVPRATKYFCLALYYNFHAAFCVMVVVIIAIASATAAGLVPLVPIEEGGAEQGIVGTLVVAPIFLLSVCFGHELRRLGGCCDPSVFLDKTCVPQADPELMKECILKLGAFIQMSSQMVIIYTDIYLRKLWTVYEVACFLSLHSRSSMAVVHPCMPWMILGGFGGGYVARILGLVLQRISGVSQTDSTVRVFELFSLLMQMSLAAGLFRFLARTRDVIHQRLTGFKVEQCMCACEEDRPLIYYNIDLLMRATGTVGGETTEEESTAAFNDVVRKRLLAPLAASIGLKYIHCVAFHLSVVFPYRCESMVGLPFPEGQRTRQQVCILLWASAGAFGIVPLQALYLSKYCKLHLHLSGCKERAFLALGVFLVVASIVVTKGIHDAILRVSVHDDSGLVGLIVILVASALLANAAFAQDYRVLQDQDVGEEAEEPNQTAAEEEPEPWLSVSAQDAALHKVDGSSLGSSFLLDDGSFLRYSIGANSFSGMLACSSDRLVECKR